MTLPGAADPDRAESLHREIDAGWVLPAPDARLAIHTRSIVCRSFRRDDGLLDVDGRFIDTRAFDYHSPWRGDCLAGEALHQMQLRLTVDRQRCIHALASAMPGTPYVGCSEVNPNFQRLVGMSLGRGFRKAMREKIGGVEGCTHVIALLDTMASAAVQAFASNFHAPRPAGAPQPVRIFNPEALVGTCHSYRPDGPVMARLRQNLRQNVSD